VPTSKELGGDYGDYFDRLEDNPQSGLPAPVCVQRTGRRRAQAGQAAGEDGLRGKSEEESGRLELVSNRRQLNFKPSKLQFGGYRKVLFCLTQ
jgi:hypothetical protein